MSYVRPLASEHQRRRWLRPDWQRWMRQDAHLFSAPDPNSYRSYASRLVERRRVEEEQSAHDAETKRLCRDHLEVRRHLADLKFEFAWRRLCHKYGYNPSQPRDELGKWTNAGGARTLVAGPATGRGLARLGASFPGARYDQLVRLDQAIARTENAVARVRDYDPSWRPTQQEVTARPSGIQAAIGSAEARAREAEARIDRLRLGIGGNSRFSPHPVRPAADLPGTGPYFDAPAWANAYRAAHNMPDLFGHTTWPLDKGTVAVAKIDGVLIFGVNSGAPGYANADRADAVRWRATLIDRYPHLMDTENIGRAPNDFAFHAEATVLYRVARESGGSLGGRYIEVHTDRPVCATSCIKMLPKLGLELDNPTVTFVDHAGVRRTMRDGSWLP